MIILVLNWYMLLFIKHDGSLSLYRKSMVHFTTKRYYYYPWEVTTIIIFINDFVLYISTMRREDYIFGNSIYSTSRLFIWICMKSIYVWVIGSGYNILFYAICLCLNWIYAVIYWFNKIRIQTITEWKKTPHYPRYYVLFYSFS